MHNKAQLFTVYYNIYINCRNLQRFRCFCCCCCSGFIQLQALLLLKQPKLHLAYSKVTESVTYGELCKKKKKGGGGWFFPLAWGCHSLLHVVRTEPPKPEYMCQNQRRSSPHTSKRSSYYNSVPCLAVSTSCFPC